MWNDTDFAFRFVALDGGDEFQVEITRDGGREVVTTSSICETMSDAVYYLMDSEFFTQTWMEEQIGWDLSGNNEELFWNLQVLIGLDSSFRGLIKDIEGYMEKGSKAKIYSKYAGNDNRYNSETNTVYWNPNMNKLFQGVSGVKYEEWHSFPPLAGLAHELSHLREDLYLEHHGRRIGLRPNPTNLTRRKIEKIAIVWENKIRTGVNKLMPNRKYKRRRNYFPDEYWRMVRRGRRGIY